MRRTLNPVYDEDFTFYGIHFSQLPVSFQNFVGIAYLKNAHTSLKSELSNERLWILQLAKLRATKIYSLEKGKIRIGN